MIKSTEEENKDGETKQKKERVHRVGEKNTRKRVKERKRLIIVQRKIKTEQGKPRT